MWAEVPTPCGTSACDLVGRSGAALRLVELKMAWSKKLLYQCYLHQLASDDVWAACGANPKPSTIENFKARGIGMVRVVGSGCVVILSPVPIKNVVAWYAGKINAHLDRMAQGEDGGKPCLCGEGPAQDCEKGIREYRAGHPKATWDEVYANVPNHYVSAKSMYGAMRMLRQRRSWAAAVKERKQSEALKGHNNSITGGGSAPYRAGVGSALNHPLEERR